MSEPKYSQFVVRELKDETELTRCQSLDHTYETDFVWQMDMREESEDTLVRFRSVRLPRTMQVAYPRSPHVLAQSWANRECFLVASVEDFIIGYANMRIDHLYSTAWVYDLVVDRRVRRRRIGSALLEQSARWARMREVDMITLELQTKNAPGIGFAKSLGFSFCGFNDHYYRNRDIAIFFSRNL